MKRSEETDVPEHTVETTEPGIAIGEEEANVDVVGDTFRLGELEDFLQDIGYQTEVIETEYEYDSERRKKCSERM